MKEETPIKEARRYVKNARKTLRENGDLDVEQNRYRDEKNMKAAGNYLWDGVLIALDAVFNVKTGEMRVDINDYRQAIGKRDRKLLGLVNDGYEYIHLYMTYEGCLSKRSCDTGFHLANEIIDKCAVMLGETLPPAA